MVVMIPCQTVRYFSAQESHAWLDKIAVISRGAGNASAIENLENYPFRSSYVTRWQLSGWATVYTNVKKFCHRYGWVYRFKSNMAS